MLILIQRFFFFFFFFLGDRVFMFIPVHLVNGGGVRN